MYLKLITACLLYCVITSAVVILFVPFLESVFVYCDTQLCIKQVELVLYVLFALFLIGGVFTFAWVVGQID